MNHSFNVEVAIRYGVPCALVLGHIDFLVAKAKKDGVNKQNGRYWANKSVKKIAEMYPYYTEKQIRRAIDKLRSEGLVVTGHFPTSGCPSTLWYTLTRKGKTLISMGDSDLPSGANQYDHTGETNSSSGQNDQPSGANQYDHTGVSSTKVLDSVLDSFVDSFNSGGGGNIDNPFGEAATAAAPTMDPLVAYAQNNLMYLGPYNMDELISFRDALPDELIQHAIDEACAAGVRRYKYVKSILNRYVEQGFKSVAEVKTYESQRKKQKGGTNGGNNRSDLPTAPQRIAGETIV